MSTNETRLNRLEELAGVTDWPAVRPADCPPDRWEEIGSLLRSLPAERFAPWRDYDHVCQWLKEYMPDKLVNAPDAVVSASIQLDCAARGIECPDWQVKDLSDEQLEALIEVQGHRIGNGGELTPEDETALTAAGFVLTP